MPLFSLHRNQPSESSATLPPQAQLHPRQQNNSRTHSHSVPAASPASRATPAVKRPPRNTKAQPHHGYESSLPFRHPPRHHPVAASPAHIYNPVIKSHPSYGQRGAGVVGPYQHFIPGPIPYSPPAPQQQTRMRTQPPSASAVQLSSPPPPPVSTACPINASLQQLALSGKWQSCTNLNLSWSGIVSTTVEMASTTLSELEQCVREYVGNRNDSDGYGERRGGGNGGCARLDMYHDMSRKLDQVITTIDWGMFSGLEKDLLIACARPILPRADERATQNGRIDGQDKFKPGVMANYFSKVNFYANSRLPPHLPPLKLYLPTYPLLCLAAQYSHRAYGKPTSSAERAFYVSADKCTGTKAMVIQSLPIDDMNTVVFAIRGTQSFRDWAVNMKTAPTSPKGFLDDPSNLCHAGFLSVAKKMVRPVAARLRSLLAENPNRATYSLMITGHSAGGAVASLLYLHMLSETIQSELTHLRGFFKRVHCVTFGAPPLSLYPLQRPMKPEYSKSIFFAFINEGDPVPRADKAYVLSLLDLYASMVLRNDGPPGTTAWPVPPSSLALAGRLVLLRGTGVGAGAGAAQKISIGKITNPGKSTGKDLKRVGGSGQVAEDVQAYVTTDAEMRGVVFGDPLMHMMDLYAQRVELLAVKAVTVKS